MKGNNTKQKENLNLNFEKNSRRFLRQRTRSLKHKKTKGIERLHKNSEIKI